MLAVYFSMGSDFIISVGEGVRFSSVASLEGFQSFPRKTLGWPVCENFRSCPGFLWPVLEAGLHSRSSETRRFTHKGLQPECARLPTRLPTLS